MYMYMYMYMYTRYIYICIMYMYHMYIICIYEDLHAISRRRRLTWQLFLRQERWIFAAEE